VFSGKTLIFACLVCVLLIQWTYSQIMIDPSKPDFVVGVGNVFNDDLRVDLGEFILIDRFRQSLELSESQEKTLLVRMQETGVQNFQLNQLIVKETDPDKFREHWEVIQQNQISFTSFVESTLLPHQVALAKQLAFQNYLSSVKLEDVISNAFAKSLANATEEERKLFDQAAIEIKRELDQKIYELKLEAVKQLIKNVPAEHRGNLNSVLELPSGIAIELPSKE